MAWKLRDYFKVLAVGHRFYMGGDAPKAPDPYQTANAQLGMNKQQANLDAGYNRYTQNNPFGTVSWTNSGTTDNPQWSQNTTLSQPQQQLYDTQLGTQNSLSGQAQTYANGTLKDILSSAPQGADNTTFNQVQQGLLDRMQPGLDHATGMLTAQLANQGLTPGSAAYQRAMLTNSQQNNDANLATIAQATQAEQAQQQMSNTQRNQAMTEMGGLIQGSGNVNMPTYGGSTSVNTGSSPDIAGLISQNYQNEMAGYNADQAGKNGLLSAGIGALGQAGGSWAGGGSGLAGGGGSTNASSIGNSISKYMKWK